MRERLSAGTALMAWACTMIQAPAAQAQHLPGSGSMNREEIVAAFVDRQLSGIYPSGSPWSELIRSDGTSDYREGPQRREGRWWMRGDHFCFSYALPMSGGCFRVIQIGTNCYELYAVNPGEEAAPSQGRNEHWNGRMWRDDASPTCEERPTS